MITQEMTRERKKNSTPPWLMSGPAGRRRDAGHGPHGIRRKKKKHREKKKREMENKYTEINTVLPPDFIFQKRIHHPSMCEMNDKPYLTRRWA